MNVTDDTVSHLQSGKLAEDAALQYLYKHNLILIARNWHCRFGEIDLIMQDQQQLVFVEVRFRRSTMFGGSLASIGAAKQQRIINAAQQFLQENRRHRHKPSRFDVIAIDRHVSEKNVTWIRNAFTND